MAEPKLTARATDEQLLYANILEKGMLVGLLLFGLPSLLTLFWLLVALRVLGRPVGLPARPLATLEETHRCSRSPCLRRPAPS